ncbi:flavodoxin [Clostridioides difficile]
MKNNILIAYFSYTGNTQEVAEQIQNIVGGKLLEIKPEQDYSSDYDTCESQANKEVKEGYRPKLATECEDIDYYNIVFIGTPNWFNTIAPPVVTFLSENDMSVKTIIPFCTNGGGGLGHVVSDIHAFCNDANILDCLEIYENGGRNSESKIIKWLEKNGFKN